MGSHSHTIFNIHQLSIEKLGEDTGEEKRGLSKVTDSEPRLFSVEFQPSFELESQGLIQTWRPIFQFRIRKSREHVNQVVFCVRFELLLSFEHGFLQTGAKEFWERCVAQMIGWFRLHLVLLGDKIKLPTLRSTCGPHVKLKENGRRRAKEFILWGSSWDKLSERWYAFAVSMNSPIPVRFGPMISWLLCVLFLGGGQGCVRYAAPEGIELHAAYGKAAVALQNTQSPQMVARADIVIRQYVVSRQIKGNLVLRQPGDLRLQLLSPTDDLLAVLTVNSEETRYFERGGEGCFIQVGCDGKLGTLLPLPISASELVHILLGGGPEFAGVQNPMEWDDTTGEIVLRETRVNGNERTLRLDPCSYAFRGAEWFVDGEEILKARSQEEGVFYFEVPSENIEVEIRFVAIDRDMEVGDDAFYVECPQGMAQAVSRCEPKEGVADDGK